MEGREIIDVLTAYPPQGLAAQAFVGMLRRLQPRLYSIASSLLAHEEEAHLLVGLTRYESHGRAREGVCSGYLCQRRGEDEPLRVYLSPNPLFRLPASPDARVIMIGPGTGVAPFRAFVEERAALGCRGRNWLFFGDQHFTTDFLYQVEWQRWHKSGVLSRLDLAFSRDQPEKLYVQQRMRETARDIYAWLQDGAYLYVCGDASAMAADVHETLIAIAAEQGGKTREAAVEYVEGLQASKRYLRDVYCARDRCSMIDEKPIAPGSSENELIKDGSDYLRGTIAQGLADSKTGGVVEPDQQLMKFHGMYQQDDRDVRLERQHQKLEPLYSFMVRVRMPGGVCTPAQYLTLDRLAREYGGGSLRLTTRQTFQLHTVPKRHLRATVQGLHKVLLDTVAACGDVNRNVMCNPNPALSSLHGEVYGWAKRLSEHLLPRTRAYHEIWLGDDLVAGGEPPADEEPLYGRRYLPRKFKIAIAVPPSNDVDVLRQRSGLHRHRGRRQAERLRRDGGRRHGDVPRGEEHLPAAGRRHRLRARPRTSSPWPRRCSPRSAISAIARTASTPGSSTPSTTAASTGSRARSSAAWATRCRRPALRVSTATGIAMVG